MIVLGLFLASISNIWSSFLKVMGILFPIMVIAIFLQSIAPAFPQPWTPIAHLGPFTIYQEGIYSGLTLFERTFSMTIFAMVFIMTTHPSDLSFRWKRSACRM
jgi:Cobalt transport protein.